MSPAVDGIETDVAKAIASRTEVRPLIDADPAIRDTITEYRVQFLPFYLREVPYAGRKSVANPFIYVTYPQQIQPLKQPVQNTGSHYRGR